MSSTTWSPLLVFSDRGRRLGRHGETRLVPPRGPGWGWRRGWGVVGLAALVLVVSSGCLSGESSSRRQAGEANQDGDQAGPAIIQVESWWFLASEKVARDLVKEWPGLAANSGLSRGTLSALGPDVLGQLAMTNPNVRLDTARSSTAVELTAAQARRLREWTKGREGIEVKVGPHVTALDGRQAQVQAVEMRTLVTGVSTHDQGVDYLTTTVPLGPVLDVVPKVQADGVNLGMTILAALNEFVGYDDPGDWVPTLTSTTSSGVDGPIRATLPLPRLRVRQLQASAVVRDGSSLLLGSGAWEGQLKAPAAAGGGEGAPKVLLVLITPTLVDSDGNRVHSKLK